MKLQTKFILISLLSISMLAGLVYTNTKASDFTVEQTGHLRRITMITQRHMEGDMMHDAIRGDVLSAIVASGKGDFQTYTQSGKDLAEHYAKFKENLSANQAEERVPDNIRAQFDRTLTALEAYHEAAKEVIGTAGQNTGVGIDAAMADFSQKFEEMEEEQESISEAIGKWAEEEEQESVTTTGLLGKILFVLSAIALITAIVVPVFAARAIFAPLRSLLASIQTMAAGNFDIDIAGSSRRDEIGGIAQAVVKVKEAGIEKMKAEEEARRVAAEADAQRRARDRQEMATRFEERVQGIIQTVAATATELFQTSESMSGVVTNTSGKAGDVAFSAGETLQGVQNVASAIEEMTATVNEIAHQISRSSQSVQQVVQQVEKADETAALLDVATQKIGQVVDVIQGITEQINLLALNATIESARAGDAGKGFAVVAGEVKNLAGETSKATEEVAESIQSIQSVSNQVITAMNAIKAGIDSVNAISAAISSAVEEQTSTTREISTSMAIAARGTEEISANIGDVSKSATEASAIAEQTRDAAKSLSIEAEKLRGEVGQFIAEMRSEAA